MFRMVALGLTVLTGFSGLVYEVAWQRYLGVLVGVDHAATSATLAVFLGGLSLGYAICGRLSARSTRPLWTYAWLEVAIAAWGLAFPWTFRGNESLASGWSVASPLGLIAASLGATSALVIDDGAVRALRHGGSLLPAGVRAVEGEFGKGDTVLIQTAAGVAIAKGLAGYDAADARRIAGRRTEEIETILGWRGRDEIVHRLRRGDDRH